LRKRGLKTDPEVQLLEDVICLVFLEHYFHDFAQKHSEEKLLPIVQKTWKKMSAQAHEAALQIEYAPEDRVIIEKSLRGA
jgi:F0F1-type ATP synthase gamma subunit